MFFILHNSCEAWSNFFTTYSQWSLYRTQRSVQYDTNNMLSCSVSAERSFKVNSIWLYVMSIRWAWSGTYDSPMNFMYVQIKFWIFLKVQQLHHFKKNCYSRMKIINFKEKKMFMTLIKKVEGRIILKNKCQV